MRAGASSPDPYVFDDYAYVPGNRNTSGLTRVDPRIAAGETTATFISLGQSNSPGASFVDTPYVPTHPTKVQMLNVYDGGVYLAADPLLGQNGITGNWLTRTADKLITAGKYQRIIAASVSMGGSAAATWQQGAALYPRALAVAKRCAAVGLPVTGFIWHQGESDNTFGTTSAAYQASVNSLIAGLRAAGFTSPWLICKASYISGAVSATIQGAQDALVNIGQQIYAGPNTDTLTGTSVNRQADNTHFKAAGADAAAALLSTAIQAAL
ncbi:sialate O-acetylesterase [Mesorhizobium sp. L2C085B000]|uniref:sialate O-acetylesterase n=1 Tax=Mesorhizobium sp. L2C085B000 TaxID=1287117 RepID=UPI0009DF45D7|nr:sialate O-acetylesterase [Mesorhizobium sp. L2C085B000]